MTDHDGIVCYDFLGVYFWVYYVQQRLEDDYHGYYRNLQLDDDRPGWDWHVSNPRMSLNDLFGQSFIFTHVTATII